MSESKDNVIAYKYHPDTKILNMRLSGGYYRFKDVPQSAYDAFVTAGGESPAYVENIQGKFKAEYIQEGPASSRLGRPKDEGL